MARRLSAEERVERFLEKITMKRIVKALETRGSGDCWLCARTPQDRVLAEQTDQEPEHLLEHMKNNYLTGSMLVNAYYDQQASLDTLDHQRYIEDLYGIKEILREYLLKWVDVEHMPKRETTDRGMVAFPEGGIVNYRIGL
jgi:hypothetical protein